MGSSDQAYLNRLIIKTGSFKQAHLYRLQKIVDIATSGKRNANFGAFFWPNHQKWRCGCLEQILELWMKILKM